MKWRPANWVALGAASGLVGVAAGAFAAHGLADPAREWMRTGATYELFHAVAILVCASLAVGPAPRARHAPPLFLAGTLLFSGSLYAMALGAPRWLGAVTPIGGLLFLAGWAVLAWAGAARGIDTDASMRMEANERIFGKEADEE